LLKLMELGFLCMKHPKTRWNAQRHQTWRTLKSGPFLVCFS
jgi:hypothetical protein